MHLLIPTVDQTREACDVSENARMEKEISKQRLVSLLSIKTEELRSAAILEKYSEPRVQNTCYLANITLLAQTPLLLLYA